MVNKTTRGVQTFDQWLLDALLATPVTGFANRLRYRLLRGIRRLRLLFSDPLVSFSLGPCRLKLPLSHELPFYRRSYPAYSINLGRISRHISRKYSDLTVIDVGANVGDSVAILRNYGSFPILCVEGEPRFFQLLAQNTSNLRDLELEQTFVGANGDHIVSIHSQAGNAEVRLGSAPGTAKLCTLSEVIARHPRFSSARLLKLDAEGFDCRIIASENELLRRTKPVLFFEYYPTCCELTGQVAFPVFAQLAALGYSNLLIYENQGRYSKALEFDQINALADLHQFLVKVGGYCDIVAFHAEDSDLARNVQTAEEAAHTCDSQFPESGAAMYSPTDKFGRVLLFVAHPDDESIACNGLLQRAESSLVVFAVDGAPPHYGFEQKFSSLRQYSDTRFLEASRALAGLPRAEFRRLTKPDGSYFQDQHLFLELPAAYASLKQRILEYSPDLLVTHAFEGGHIDHDACHILAARAAQELGISTLEFPLYWQSMFGRDIFQKFRTRSNKDFLLKLSTMELDRKRHMLGHYATQVTLTKVFQLDSERFRPLVPQEIQQVSWRSYAFENRKRRLKTREFLERVAEFKRSVSTGAFSGERCANQITAQPVAHP
jgi:FkbM family methyltransferase